MMFYTSGTTGATEARDPYHRRRLEMSIAHLADVEAVDEGATLIHAAPMSHGSGLYIRRMPGEGRDMPRSARRPRGLRTIVYGDRLDEATEGLTPLVRQKILRTLGKIKERGQTALIVDRDFNALEQLAERFSMMDKGRVAYSGSARGFVGNRTAIECLLAVGE